MSNSRLEEKKEIVVPSLRPFGTSIFRVYVPQGTYYALVDIRSLGFEDDVAFCRMLSQEAGVAAIPCSAFYYSNSPARHLVRLAFCKKDETLQEAVRRLKKWKTNLTG